MGNLLHLLLFPLCPPLTRFNLQVSAFNTNQNLNNSNYNKAHCLYLLSLGCVCGGSLPLSVLHSGFPHYLIETVLIMSPINCLVAKSTGCPFWDVKATAHCWLFPFSWHSLVFWWSWDILIWTSFCHTRLHVALFKAQLGTSRKYMWFKNIAGGTIPCDSFVSALDSNSLKAYIVYDITQSTWHIGRIQSVLPTIILLLLHHCLAQIFPKFL